MDIFEFKRGAKLTLAVSGGVDSMAMLFSLVDQAKVRDYSLQVVTVNHNIRKEGKADALFVKNKCDVLGITCDIKEVNALEYAKQKRISVETAARILRHEIFAEYSEKCDYVCLAHNKNDRTETVLMHLLRGSGISGAVGMGKIDGYIARPLLDITRTEIEEYVRDKNIEFVTDSTNASTEYKRNFLRLKIMPLLRELNENVENAICSFADIAAAEDAFMCEEAKAIPVMTDEKSAIIPIEMVEIQPQVLRMRAYRQALSKIKGLTDVSFKGLNSIDRLVFSIQSGKKVDLPNGICVAREFNCLRFFKKQSSEEREYEFREGEFDFGGKMLIVTKHRPSQKCLRIDKNALPKECVIRKRRDGDRFYRFGGFDKKLKEFFIERKIPLSERDGLPLIAKAERIFVVGDKEIAESVKVTEKTKEVLYIFFRGTNERT